MMKQYPYEVTYKLNSTGNNRFSKRVEAACQAEAKRLFEADMPSATILYATPLPQNRRRLKEHKLILSFIISFGELLLWQYV